MRKLFKLIMSLAVVITLWFSVPVLGQAPPPPAHSQNGNQVSPGGTGCPIDRADGIVIALVISLCYAGFALYRKGSKEIAE